MNLTLPEGKTADCVAEMFVLKMDIFKPTLEMFVLKLDMSVLKMEILENTLDMFAIATEI